VRRILISLLVALVALLVAGVGSAAEGGPPKIVLQTPSSLTTFDTQQTISGVVSDDSGQIGQVTLSDGQALHPSGAGSLPFGFQVVLNPGLNQYRVSASDAAGNESVVLVDYYLIRGEVGLRVSVSGRGRVEGYGISCRSACSEDAYLGDRIQLEAKPVAGWRFVKWLGSCRSSQGPACKLQVRGDVETSAVFRRLAG
jgi:hypothetical protein